MKDTNRAKKKYKFKDLPDRRFHTICEMNKDLPGIYTEQRVADPFSGLVNIRRVIDWKNCTRENVYKILKKHGRI